MVHRAWKDRSSFNCVLELYIDNPIMLSPQIEAQEYLGSCSCPQYMERAERRLHEEKERCDNYLDPSSEPKITRVVETELIRKQVCAASFRPAFGRHFQPLASTTRLMVQSRL